MKASEVFAAVIRYFKDHMLDKLRQRTRGVRDEDIRWVLTVPAIWSDAAKQFMIEAGVMVIYYY